MDDSLLSKKLDEEVARAHLSALNVRLTVMTPAQAEYLMLPVEGPYKSVSFPLISTTNSNEMKTGPTSTDTNRLAVSYHCIFTINW